MLKLALGALREVGEQPEQVAAALLHPLGKVLLGIESIEQRAVRRKGGDGGDDFMIKHIRLKHRLLLPIALLGMVALLSNILSILNIRNVNANASNIADNYMDGSIQLNSVWRQYELCPDELRER